MKKAAKHIVSALAAVLLFSAFAFSAHALNTRSVGSYSETGYTLNDRTVLAPSDDDESCLAFSGMSSEEWSCSGMITNSYTHKSAGVLYYCAETYDISVPDSQSVGATFSLDLEGEEIDTAEYNTLKFALGVRGGIAGECGYYVNTYIVTSDAEFCAETCVKGAETSSELSVICVDLSDVGGVLRSVRITVKYNLDTLPDSIMLSSPYLDKSDGGFANTAKYLTAGFTAGTGKISVADGKITTDRNGDASFDGAFAGGIRECGGKAYIIVETDGIRSGSIEVSVTYREKENGRLITRSSPRVSVIAGETERLFPFDVNGCVMSYSVSFSGVSSDEGFYLRSVRMFDGESDAVVGNIGKLSSVRREGDTVKFAGSVDRETAKQYSDGSIGFYAVSGGDDGCVTEIGRTAITTQFEFTADLYGYPVSADTYKFTAAVISQDGEILPISAPRYCDAEKTVFSGSSKLGFSSTPAASAFEANASYYIVDVPLDKLISDIPETTVPLDYTVYGPGDGGGSVSQRRIGLSKGIISAMDSDVNFCISSGMRVYIRFTSSTVIGGLTYGEKTARNYAVVLRDEESRQLYCALVKFFSERYSGLDGFVIGTNSSLDSCVGVDILSDPAKYFYELADVCRVTYNSCLSLDDPLIVVPMCDGAEFSLADGALMLCDRLDDIGGIPIALMCCTSELGGEDIIERVSRIVSESGTDIISAEMVVCEADEKQLMAEYLDGRGENDVTEQLTFPEYIAARVEGFCAAQSADAVFVSLKGGELIGGREVYSALKRMNENGFVAEFGTSVDVGENDGEPCELWDFGDKYYLLGWRSVGTSSCMSDWCLYGDDGTKRCLKATFGEENGASGALICNFDRVADLTDADTLKVTLAAHAEDESGYITAVVFLGTDENRAEFSANVPTNGGQRTLICDLTEYELRDRTDFVGIMVYADGGAVLEVENISLYGSDGLKNGIFPQDAPVQEKDESNSFGWIVSGVLILMALVLFIMIFRRERESSENRNETADKRLSERVK